MTQKWFVKPLDGCVSSTGKPYKIALRKGTANKLLVNFAGGGLSWSEETAARPFRIGAMLGKKDFYYTGDVPSIAMKLLNSGIFNTKDRRNPFHDWHIVLIPYTSGDLHVGNNDYPFQNRKGENKVLYHHGNKNVASALAALKEFFPQTPETLVIAGQSAGGHGCVAHCPQISELYPACNNIVVYSEVSCLRSSLWPEIAKNVWNVPPDLMAYIKSEDLIADLFRYAKDNMPPSARFLHFNSVWDGVNAKYMYKMNHGSLSINTQALQEYHDALSDVARTLKKEIPNYFYYLTDHEKSQKNGTTPHMFSDSQKRLHSKMQDGMSLAKWISKGIEDKPVDIGAKFARHI